jgi:pimeloyl-ACP methyl ester carboxylesterase
MSSACHITAIYSPGMCGERFIDRIAMRALGECGPKIVMHPWTRHRWPLTNLRNRAQHARAADELAALVEAERAAGRSIVLIGHSTGCLVALETLQRLKQPVAHTVLLAPAVSSGYDLRPSLPMTHRLSIFHSPFDILVSLGTMICGSADGRYGGCGGWRGFRGPGSDDPRVCHQPFRTSWMKWLYLGGHIGVLNPRFIRNVLWPHIA